MNRGSRVFIIYITNLTDCYEAIFIFTVSILSLDQRKQIRSKNKQQKRNQGVAVYTRTTFSSIHTPIPIMNKFSVSEMKPSGTLLSPPTQAHFSSRFWI